MCGVKASAPSSARPVSLEGLASTRHRPVLSGLPLDRQRGRERPTGRTAASTSPGNALLRSGPCILRCLTRDLPPLPVSSQRGDPGPFLEDRSDNVRRQPPPWGGGRQRGAHKRRDSRANRTTFAGRPDSWRSRQVAPSERGPDNGPRPGVSGSAAVLPPPVVQAATAVEMAARALAWSRSLSYQGTLRLRSVTGSAT